MGANTLRTKTTLFLLPLLGKDKDEVITDEFLNAYIVESLDYIVLNYKDKFEKIHVPENKVDTVNKFLKGKYSQINSQDKFQILSFWGLTRNSRLYSILNPKDFLYEETGLLFDRKEVYPAPSVHDDEWWTKEKELIR